MESSRHAIRNQLLILGAIATGAIWSGAFLQYRELRSESSRLEHVFVSLAESNRYAAIAQFAAKERGISNGWLHRASADPAELAPPRAALDQALVAIVPIAGHPVVAAVASRVEDLNRQRILVNQRAVDPTTLFAWYSGLIAALQDTAARGLADSMVEVGLPYEHVNEIRRAVEQLAQMRGISNGALSAGTLSEADHSEILRRLTLFEEDMHLYEGSAPAPALARNAAAISAVVLRESIDRIQRLVDSRQLDVLQVPGGWWPLATEAVDTLDGVAMSESAVLNGIARDRIHSLESRMQLTVGALIVLGLITLALVMATIGRIVQGLNTLLVGLDSAAVRRNLKTRMDEDRRDEFGIISGGINRLIVMASAVIDEHEQQSLTDPMTGLLNRRGLGVQLEARMNPQRVYSMPTSVLMIDADHFKRINDEFGHPTGDRVLIGLAQIIHENLRADDVAGRYGGEEFLAILTGCQRDEALRVAEKIRAAVASHDFGLGRPVTVSLGVAQRHAEIGGSDVVAYADAALYRAKMEGRNRVIAASDMAMPSFEPASALN